MSLASAISELIPISVLNFSIESLISFEEPATSLMALTVDVLSSVTRVSVLPIFNLRALMSPATA